jgi:hypothetical protein
MAEVTHDEAPLEDAKAVEGLLEPVPLEEYKRTSLQRTCRKWVEATKTAYWVQAASGALHRITIRGLRWPEVRDLGEAFKLRHKLGSDPIPLLRELVAEQLAFRPERERRETFFGYLRDLYNVFKERRDGLDGLSADDVALLRLVHARLPPRPFDYWGYPKIGFRQSQCEHCGRTREKPKPRTRSRFAKEQATFTDELGQDGFRHWLKSRTKKGDYVAGATALFNDYRQFWKREYKGSRNDKTAVRLALMTRPKFGRALLSLDWCKRVKRNRGYVYLGIGLKM